MSGNLEPMQRERQDTARETETCIGDTVSVYENHTQDCRYRELKEVCSTLASNLGTGGNNQPLVVDDDVTAYRICSAGSNAMNSDNPHSGIYETDVSNTIDTSDQSPAKSQGGCIVLERPGHEEHPVYTTGKASYHTRANTDVCETLVATDYKDPQTVCEYPYQLSKASKPQTDKQIVKWLKNPHTDSAEYKMWGNGVALPCVRYILEKIKEHDDDITGLSEQVHQG